MLKNCGKWLFSGVLLISLSGLNGCGSGLEQAVWAAEQSSLVIQPNLGQLQQASQSSTNTLEASGWLGESINVKLTATGGNNPYRWSVASGSLPTGLSLDSSGNLSGLLKSVGNWTASIQVVDHSIPGRVKSQLVAFNVYPSPLTIRTDNLISGVVGSEYSSTLLAAGGTPDYVWSLKSGRLPSGLKLTSQGVVIGTPSSTGLSTFAVNVNDAGSPAQQLTKSYSLLIAASSLSMTTTTLPTGQAGRAYSFALAAKGGTPGYTWSISAGALPAGLALSSSGILSGTPMNSGTSTFAVAVSDASAPAQMKTQALSLTVSAAALTITSSTVADAQNGWIYSTTLHAAGGKPTYVWSLSAGALPKGLTLNNAGTISGTPSSSGTAAFTVAAHDTSSPTQQATKALSMTVTSSSLSIGTASLAGATSGSGYSASLTVTGGTPDYTWSLGSGTLPAGLTMSSTGVISGTPTASGTAGFTVQVTDNGSPAQQATKAMAITVAAAPLTITSMKMASGQSTVAYAALLTAAGGTPGYTWNVTSGSLPSGLSLSATTGAILGTPSAAGSTAFTYKVMDNGSPQQTATATATITIGVAPVIAGPQTWFIRTDGGTRYSVNTPLGQCDGKADTAYPGMGANQHCAFNDVRWMLWDNTYGKWQWVMQGGDTLVIRGCAATATQEGPDNPHCRIGWDKATGNDNDNPWCWGSSVCSIPSPPSGTAAQHTRILGGCAYGNYNCNPVNTYPYTNNNLTQLFGGFPIGNLLDLSGSQYVDLEGLELTTHNGKCARYGTTHPLPGCNRGSNYPLSDQTDQGIITNNKTSDILLQDLYIHGFSSNGIAGPIGGPVTLTRVAVVFNAFAGWNFDDGIPTPNADGASVAQSYVTMIGNGCQEEYPIVHTQFPAKGCWDSSTGGFGDAWSGQNSNMASFTCDHCNISYNTKDGAMGPHTVIHNIVLTNSVWAGNMGQSGKWGQDAGSNFLFQNNILLGNCMRLSQQMPGAAQNFDSGTNTTGSGLAGYCRAAGPLFDYYADANATVNFNNNTVVTYQPTIFEPGCKQPGTCSTAPYRFTNNLVLGYTSAYATSPFNPGQAPGLFYSDDSSVVLTGSHNIFYGIRNDHGMCGNNGNICNADPLLVNEPAQGSMPPESALDSFNYHPTAGSPAVSYGVSYAGFPSTDIYGGPQSLQPTVGAVVP